MISTYIQYSSLYQKPYSWIIALFTFIIIAYPEYPYQNDVFEWQSPLARFINILVGGIIGLLFVLPFPVLAYSKLQASFIDSVHKTAEFISVVVKVDDLHLKYQELAPTVKNINASIQDQSRLLKEAKSELFLICKKRETMMQIMEHMSHIAFLLVVVEEVSHGGFSDQLKSEVFEPLQAGFDTIGKVTELQAQLFKTFIKTGKFHPAHQLATKKIKKTLKKIQSIHLKTRNQVLVNKRLHTLQPEMIKFNAFLFTIQLLVVEWGKMIELATT